MKQQDKTFLPIEEIFEIFLTISLCGGENNLEPCLTLLIINPIVTVDMGKFRQVVINWHYYCLLSGAITHTYVNQYESALRK